MLSFLTLTIIFVLAAIFSIFLNSTANKIRNFRATLSNIHFQSNQLFNAETTFLLMEGNDINFHLKGSCPLIILREDKMLQVTHSLEQILTNEAISSFENSNELKTVHVALLQHQLLFRKLLNQIKERGFKDYGLEGNMRNQIHQLEYQPGLLSQSDILTLRRHEKDFLLRDDSIYVANLNQLGKQMLEKLNQEPDASKNQINWLKSYLKKFNHLVQLKSQIGIYGRNGLMLQLQRSTEHIQTDLEKLLLSAKNKEDHLLAQINYAFYATIIAFIGLGIWLSYMLAKKRSNPIKKLQQAIKNIKTNRQLSAIQVDFNNASLELKDLLEAFNQLLAKVNRQMNEIEEKTTTLEMQNIELVKVNEELDRFVYSVSHDLRAPLASLLGLINISKNEKKLKNIYFNLELKERSVKKLDGFIHDILALSRNSRLNVQKECIDLTVLLEEIFENQKFSEIDLHLMKKIEIFQEVPFYSDLQRIQIILNNLISNAIRYQDTRKTNSYIKISISVYDDHALLEISDNGIGIHQEYLSRIFDMFFRATDHKVGSGLGLYITRETLKKLNGQIDVNSVFGQGTTFYLKIPNLFSEHLALA